MEKWNDSIACRIIDNRSFVSFVECNTVMCFLWAKKYSRNDCSQNFKFILSSYSVHSTPEWNRQLQQRMSTLNA